MPSLLTALLDANVLYPAPLRDTLMHLAVARVYVTSVASLDFGLDSVGKCLFCLHHLFFESTKSDVFGVKWPVLAPRVSFEALWGAPRRN